VRFEYRIRELAAGRMMLERVVDPVVRVHAVLRGEYAVLHRTLLAALRDDQVCRRLLTVPGIGAVVAMTTGGFSPALVKNKSRPPPAAMRLRASQSSLSVGQ
jgi:transposase